MSTIKNETKHIQALEAAVVHAEAVAACQGGGRGFCRTADYRAMQARKDLADAMLIARQSNAGAGRKEGEKP